MGVRSARSEVPLLRRKRARVLFCLPTIALFHHLASATTNLYVCDRHGSPLVVVWQPRRRDQE